MTDYRIRFQSVIIKKGKKLVLVKYYQFFQSVHEKILEIIEISYSKNKLIGKKTICEKKIRKLTQKSIS